MKADLSSQTLAVSSVQENFAVLAVWGQEQRHWEGENTWGWHNWMEQEKENWKEQEKENWKSERTGTSR